MLADLLNRCKPLIRFFMDNYVDLSDAYMEWLINAPLIDQEKDVQLKCLSIFAMKAINSEFIPIVYEGFFKFVSDDSGLQLMKNMAKMHLSHTNETVTLLF